MLALPCTRLKSGSLGLAFAAALFCVATDEVSAQKTNVAFGTEGAFIPGTPMTLKSQFGTTPLHIGSGTDTTYRDGDVVQLGYFGDPTTFAPTATTANPFLGTFLALTQETTIGDRAFDSDPIAAGVFDLNSLLDSDTGQGTIFASDPNEFAETVPDLAAKITALDAYHDPDVSGDIAYLAIRFWDVRNDDSAGDTAGFSNIDGADFKSMYNTVTDVTNGGANSPDWRWIDSDNFGQTTLMALHNENTPGAIRTDLAWELPVHIYDMDAPTTALRITGDATSVLPNSASVSDGKQFSTVLTHYAEGGAIAAGEFTSDPKIVSNLNLGSSVGGSIDAGTAARELIIYSAKGNSPEIASDSAFTLTGDLLALTKIGEGEQKISIQTGTGGTVTVREGKLILSNTASGASSGTIFTNAAIRGTTSFVDIQGSGTLKVASATADNHEWMRYVTSGDSSTTATLAFGDGDFNVELGLDLATDGIKTFTGLVATGAATHTGTINVSELTGWQQVGHLSGAGNIQKTGDGILEITGDSSGDNPNPFNGDMKLDGGTLIVSHADALNRLGMGITSGDFDRGKLSINLDGVLTFSDDIDTTGATGTTMIGGNTINGAKFDNTITIGTTAGTNKFRELDPGLAASASLSDVLAPGSGHQSVQSPGSTIGSFTATSIDWQAGGIYNWEIGNFDDSGTPGTDWDLFSYTSTAGEINFLTGQQRKIRIFGISKTGYAGPPVVGAGEQGIPDDWAWPAVGTSNAYKFFQGPDDTSFKFNGSYATDGQLFNSNYFDIDDEGFSWLTRDWNGVWQVQYKASDTSLYLVYAAVPEPSTYVMVVGALFLPVWNFVRRRRSRRKEEE